MVKKITTVVLSLVVFILFFSLQNIYSAECDDKTRSEKVSCLEQKLQQLNQQKGTLSSQIQYMDTQISLTTLRIDQTEQKIISTEKEIDQLGSRIEGLDQSLDYLSKQLIQRIVVGYKKKPLSLFSLLLDNKNANDFLNQVKYLKTAQTNNQKLLYTVQETKTNAEEQKKLREEKKVELDKLNEILSSQKQSLNGQKAQKQRLLADTQNDEQIYQNLLANAREEYAAIQGIVAGKGTEIELRQVSKGELIANVISGISCNSNGTHLHFTVLEGIISQNPFNYFTNTNYVSNTSDPWTQNASKANWDWPLNSPIELNQGYGADTEFIKTHNPYPFHNGLDISSSSNTVRAVADGTLYRGSYAVTVSNWCKTGVLPYTKVAHKDSNISTLYLHTYTQ